VSGPQQHGGDLSLQRRAGRSDGDSDTAETMFDEAARYWLEAISIAPNNYIEAQNWLKNTGRMKNDVFY
jgi:hypothetical protein